jgi:hypothetical protein
VTSRACFEELVVEALRLRSGQALAGLHEEFQERLDNIDVVAVASSTPNHDLTMNLALYSMPLSACRAFWAWGVSGALMAMTWRKHSMALPAKPASWQAKPRFKMAAVCGWSGLVATTASKAAAHLAPADRDLTLDLTFYHRQEEVERLSPIHDIRLRSTGGSCWGLAQSPPATAMP